MVSLCKSHVVLVHMAYVILVCFSYTQDLPPDDSSLYLGTEMVEISRIEVIVFYLDYKGRMERLINLNS